MLINTNYYILFRIPFYTIILTVQLVLGLLLSTSLAMPLAALEKVLEKQKATQDTRTTQEQDTAIRFVYMYRAGSQFNIVSTVEEDVYINNRYSHSSDILNRISLTITSAGDTWGVLSGTFDTSEQDRGNPVYTIKEAYQSEFKRDTQGYFTINDSYFMPVVRDVPVFPMKPLKPGDTWEAAAVEKHDFRRVFGIPYPYSIPIKVAYRYEGPEMVDGTLLHKITARYSMFLYPEKASQFTVAYPEQIAGYSNQIIYWDAGLGQPITYKEQFDITIDWSNGTSTEFRGIASSILRNVPRLDKDVAEKDVQESLAGIQGVRVQKTDEGISISLDNIQFSPDSSQLEPKEALILRKISNILARYPDRDILVAGHAAGAGNAAGRKLLSEQRARIVAESLINLGTRKRDKIRAIGYGDEKPIADNSTESGRQKNRRVEIIILEN